MKLTILDPGHFHAALVQKNMIAGIDAAVDVYAPAGPDLDDYQRKIASFNARSEAPTRWELQAHAGPDYLERFVADESDGVVVLAGNNRRKIDYIDARRRRRHAHAGRQADGDRHRGLRRRWCMRSRRRASTTCCSTTS